MIASVIRDTAKTALPVDHVTVLMLMNVLLLYHLVLKMLHAPMWLETLLVNACQAMVEMDIFNVMLSMHASVAPMTVTRTHNVLTSVVVNMNANVTRDSRVMGYLVSQLKTFVQLNLPLVPRQLPVQWLHVHHK